MSRCFCQSIGVLIVAIPLLASVNAAAGDLSQDLDGSIVWKAGIDGVEMKFGPDGQFERIESQASHPVRFPDRQGVAKAQVIAEEKAKAGIVRFMEREDLTSGRVVTQIDNDVEQATRRRTNNDPDNISKTNQRTMIETVTEFTASFASGKLRGVVVLERGYSDRDEEAWVKVGISRKSMGASRALKNAIESDLGADELTRSPPNENSTDEDTLRRSKSYRRRLQNEDW